MPDYQRIIASGVVPPGPPRPPKKKKKAKKAKQTKRPRNGIPISKAGKPRLLWVGDAVVATGFASVTHSVLEHLSRSWEVLVSGVNYQGETHNYPYTIIPAQQGEDMWGADSIGKLCEAFRPDAVLVNNDPWNVVKFLEEDLDVPVIGYMPIDGTELSREVASALNGLHAAVWYTRHGADVARRAGFRGRSAVIPHGVDSREFMPMDKALARRQLGVFPFDHQKTFVVGNVNRNQPRKRLDLSVRYFANWIRGNQIEDAWLALHCARQDEGWDLLKLAEDLGVANRIVLSGGETMLDMPPRERMPLVYNSLDVQITTTAGEGWGLTTMEGMACGIPQIVPAWSALGEWPRQVEKIPCQPTKQPEMMLKGGIAQEEKFIAALHSLYQNPQKRHAAARICRREISHKRYRWKEVARQFDLLLAPRRGYNGVKALLRRVACF